MREEGDEKDCLGEISRATLQLGLPLLPCDLLFQDSIALQSYQSKLGVTGYRLASAALSRTEQLCRSASFCYPLSSQIKSKNLHYLLAETMLAGLIPRVCGAASRTPLRAFAAEAGAHILCEM